MMDVGAVIALIGKSDSHVDQGVTQARREPSSQAGTQIKLTCENRASLCHIEIRQTGDTKLPTTIQRPRVSVVKTARQCAAVCAPPFPPLASRHRDAGSRNDESALQRCTQRKFPNFFSQGLIPKTLASTGRPA